MSITYRPGRSEDVPWLHQSLKSLAAIEGLSHYFSATERDYKECLFGDKALATMLIAEKENQPIGLAIYFRDFPGYIGRPGVYLEDLYVEPEYRGQGIGTQLMRYVIEEAKRLGAPRVRLAAVHENAQARAFYQKFGASEMPEALLINFKL